MALAKQALEDERRAGAKAAREARAALEEERGKRQKVLSGGDRERAEARREAEAAAHKASVRVQAAQRETKEARRDAAAVRAELEVGSWGPYGTCRRDGCIIDYWEEEVCTIARDGCVESSGDEGLRLAIAALQTIY